MLRRYLFIYFFCAFAANAQFIDNTEGKTFGEVPYFNTDFVRRNKVKTIKGYYSTKASLDYIRKSKDVYFYEFNRNGQLVMDYRTQYGDTLISMYAYDEQGRLELLRKSDNGGFHSYHFTYDEKNRVLVKEYRRDVNKTGDKANFRLDKTFFVSAEKYSYTDMEGMDYKKMYYNTADKVYKDEFFYFEENGYLLKQEGRLRMGSGVTNTAFSYDGKGRVIEKLESKRIMSNTQSKWEYEYDEHSNVLAQHYYKNDKYISETQLVYFEETMLLEAIITKDVATNSLTILEFSEYDFFD